MRDCFMRSVLDDELLYNELEVFIRDYKEDPLNQHDQLKQDFHSYMRERDELIGDRCFVLNYSPARTVEKFTGLVSLCNTTISAFTTAVCIGKNSILFTEDSSIIYNRGRHAIYCEHPRFIKIIKTSFLKCEGNAICIDQLDMDME
jgi:hypothetical protein